MLDAHTNVSNFIPQGNSVGKLTQLPFVGNRLVQTQVPQMSVQQLQQLLTKNSSNLLLIDVRYNSEYNIAHLPGEWFLIPYQSGCRSSKNQTTHPRKTTASPQRRTASPHFV
jgi:adenylyltransferase/sulfurtransferase